MRTEFPNAGKYCLLSGLFLLAAVNGAHALLIDSFSTDQTLMAITPGISASSEASGSGILGGERDMEVTRTSGTGVTIAASEDKLTYGHIASSQGTALLVWDGADGDSALDPTGLGGLDFTESGLNSVVAIELLFNDFSAPITLTAYTDGSNYSTATLALPGNIPPDPQATLTVLFSDFSIAAGSGADFTDIGAFSLFIDGSSTPALDVELGSIALVPEPATGALLLVGLLVIFLMRRRQRAS